MDFDSFRKILNKIKNIFTKNNNDTNGIADINTSFVHVSKLSELTEEEKEKVYDFYNKLQAGSNEDLIIYSNDLMKKANTELEIFYRALIRYEKQYRIMEEYNYDENTLSISRYHLGKLSSMEYQLIEKNIINIRKELELKLIALEMHIKKEEKRKYDFLGLFGRAKRIKYLTNKEKLFSERERLLVSLMINENIIFSLWRSVKTNNRLMLYCETLYKIQNILGDEIVSEDIVRNFLINSISRLNGQSIYPIRKEFEDELEEICYKMKGYPIRKEAYLGNNKNFPLKRCLENANGVINDEIIEYILNNLKRKDNSLLIKHFIKIVPKEFLDQIYKILAKYSHDSDLYIFLHKEDYKVYLDEITEYINKCESNFKEINPEELKEKSNYYLENIDRFLEMYGTYRNPCFNELYDDKISSVTEEQLMKKTIKILFLSFIVNGYDKSKFNELKYFIIENFYSGFFSILKDLSNDVYNKFKISDQFCIEYDVLSNFDEQMIKIRDFVNYGDCLYKALNDYYSTDMYVTDKGVYNSNTLLGECPRLKSKLIENFTLGDVHFISWRDKEKLIKFYYAFASIKQDRLYYQRKSFDRTLNSLPKDIQFMLRFGLKSIDDKYDNRILVAFRDIPLFYDDDFSRILQIKDSTIALYSNKWFPLSQVDYLLENEKTNIKYLMVEKQNWWYTFHGYEDYYKDLKIIVVPDDTKFSDLSIYLDREIKNSNDKPKTLRKTLD